MHIVHVHTPPVPRPAPHSATSQQRTDPPHDVYVPVFGVLLQDDAQRPFQLHGKARAAEWDLQGWEATPRARRWLPAREGVPPRHWPHPANPRTSGPSQTLSAPSCEDEDDDDEEVGCPSARAMVLARCPVLAASRAATVGRGPHTDVQARLPPAPIRSNGAMLMLDQVR